MFSSKKVSKFFAWVCLIAVLFQALPVYALVDNFPRLQVPDRRANIDKPVELNEELASIIGEVEEKRTANEKHFLMSDGTIQAAIYNEAVHYEKKGKFVDIDNLLPVKPWEHPGRYWKP